MWVHGGRASELSNEYMNEWVNNGICNTKSSRCFKFLHNSVCIHAKHTTQLGKNFDSKPKESGPKRSISFAFNKKKFVTHTNTHAYTVLLSSFQPFSSLILMGWQWLTMRTSDTYTLQHSIKRSHHPNYKIVYISNALVSLIHYIRSDIKRRPIPNWMLLQQFGGKIFVF